MLNGECSMMRGGFCGLTVDGGSRGRINGSWNLFGPHRIPRAVSHCHREPASHHRLAPFQNLISTRRAGMGLSEKYSRPRIFLPHIKQRLPAPFLPLPLLRLMTR